MFADMVEKRVLNFGHNFRSFSSFDFHEAATRNFMKILHTFHEGTKRHSSRQDSGMGGSQNFGQRDCGTSGANGQAELLEAGGLCKCLKAQIPLENVVSWALGGTNSLSISGSWF